MSRRRWLLAAAVAVLLVLSGCTRADGAGAGGAAANPQPLAFTATTLDGQTFDGASLAGKPAVLWFWAPWCTVCRGQAPDVRSLSARHTGTVAFVGVAGLDKPPAMRDFVSSLDVAQIPHLSDEAGAVWKRFGVTRQSTFVVVDKAGSIVDRGVYDGEQLAERIAKVIG